MPAPDARPPAAGGLEEALLLALAEARPVVAHADPYLPSEAASARTKIVPPPYLAANA